MDKNNEWRYEIIVNHLRESGGREQVRQLLLNGWEIHSVVNFGPDAVEYVMRKAVQTDETKLISSMESMIDQLREENKSLSKKLEEARWLLTRSAASKGVSEDYINKIRKFLALVRKM